MLQILLQVFLTTITLRHDVMLGRMCERSLVKAVEFGNYGLLSGPEAGSCALFSQWSGFPSGELTQPLDRLTLSNLDKMEGLHQERVLKSKNPDQMIRCGDLEQRAA